MEWINIDGQNLMIQWRKFRIELEEQNLNENRLLRKVAKYWAYVPRGSRCIDYYTPQSWPSPWEILSYKLYCENTVSLMIYYTLDLLESFDGDIKIFLIDDEVDEYIAPIINDYYILNYEYGKLTRLEDIKKTTIRKKYEGKELPNFK